MSFENRVALEKSIRSQFKKLASKTEETIRKEAKEIQQEEIKLTFLHDDKYYIDKVYNPKDFPKQFDVEFEVIRNGYVSSKRYQELNDLWNWYKSRVSSLKTALPPGRLLRILVKEKHTQQYIGMISLSDVTKNIKDRDSYIEWSHDMKYMKDASGIKRLDYIMDISTCVPMQPFGYNFNAGKLLAMLCFSNDIQEICKKIYGHKIALFQTMGVNGKSAMYSRCNLDKGSESFLKYVGMTAGHGVTNLIPDTLYRECLEYLKLINDESFKNDSSMFRSKLLKLRTCMRYINISTEFLDTQAKKGIYVGFTSSNSKTFLTGKDNTFSPDEFMKATYICSKWLDRWALNRYQNMVNMKSFRYNDLSLVSIERQNETQKKTELQRQRRKRERETEDQEILKKKYRKQNNRTLIRKYISRQTGMTSDKVENILNSITDETLESKSCSEIIDILDKQYNFVKANDITYKGYRLKDGWGTIYIIKNKINGKVYIGQVSHFRTKKKVPAGFPKRMEEHSKCINGKIECVLLDRSIIKYGWKNFEKYPLLDCHIEHLDYFEKKFIVDYESHKSTGKGYNVTWGGQDQRGCNYRTGMEHHMWGKSLPDSHKESISKSNIIARRTITDDTLNQILLLKHSNNTETEVIQHMKQKYDVDVSRGLIEDIWSGNTAPLSDDNKLDNHGELINRKRKRPTTKRTKDELIEEIFKLKFQNISAVEVTDNMKKKYPETKIALPLVNKIWDGDLVPRFPSEEYQKLLKLNRTVKKRKLDDKYIEEIYFLKGECTQKEVIKKMKDDHELDIKQQDVSAIWRHNMKPLQGSNKYTNAIKTDIIEKPKRLLSDPQRAEVLSLKGRMSASQVVKKIKESYDIDIKRSYVNDIWRPVRKNKE